MFDSANTRIAAIGKDLDFQNNQISELLFLFNKNKKTILNWVESFLKEMSLEKDYITIIMTLLHLYLALLDEKCQSVGSFEDFSKVTTFLMNIEPKGSSTKRKLLLTQTN